MNYRLVKGLDIALDLDGVKQPRFGPGEALAVNFISPLKPGPYKIAIYAAGADSCWRMAWVVPLINAGDENGAPLPGPSARMFNGSVIPGVASGHDTLDIPLNVGPWKRPAGPLAAFIPAPVILEPGALYCLRVTNDTPNPNVPAATAACLVKLQTSGV